MALKGGMLPLLSLLLTVTWMVVKSELNPEADPYCNGFAFHNCTSGMVGLGNCDTKKPQKEWLNCLTEEHRKLKQMDCNDQQRKNARRLLKIYTEMEDLACSNEPTLLTKASNQTACWDTIRHRLMSNLFGFGTLPCKITEWAKNKTLGDLRYYCDPQKAEQFYSNITEVAECTDGAAGLVVNFAAVLVVSLASVISSALWWQR